MQLAAAQGGNLPAQPDSKALNNFLMQRKAADPDHFADLSLAVIKLMGPGEYVLERPGDPDVGHFGSPCRTIRTPPLPTAASPTWSRSAC